MICSGRGARGGSVIGRREVSEQQKTKNRKGKKRRLKPLTLVIIIAIVLLSGAYVRNIVKLEIEHHQLVEQNQKLKEERRQLRIELKNVNSREYIEDQARKQLRLVNPDEILFVFPDQNGNSSGDSSSGSSDSGSSSDSSSSSSSSGNS